MTKHVELANFLKTRRNKIQPEQVGLPNGTRRRTTGLRREEVAQLSGIGLTWYTWLEQGRDIQVSNQVLESITRALQLTQEETYHLFVLAGKAVVNHNFSAPNLITLAIRSLLDNIVDIPAYIMDQRWNLLAWNDISEKVFGDFNKLSQSERNIVQLMFTNKAYMDLFDDWSFHARGIIARFRASYAKYSDDTWFRMFINNLCNISAKFNEWWALHDVHGMDDVIKEINHPIVGRMVFEFVSFDVSANPNLKLIFHNPSVGTDTKHKIDMLMKQ